MALRLRSKLEELNELAREARLDQRAVAWARWLALAIIIVGLMDCVSTELALASGQAREANPVVRAMLETIGVFWLLPKMMVHGALAGMSVWYPNRVTLTALTGVACLAGLAAANNFAIYFDAVS